MNKKVVLHDKTFELFIPYEKLHQSILELAARINEDYKDKSTPLFLGVLNGSFMFMSELIKEIEFNCEISFVKLSSYSGLTSTGRISELIGLADNLKGRDIIVVEDIVDTGYSIEHLLRSLVGHEPDSVEVATLLFKPNSYKKDIPIKYSAMSVPDKFIVGFGLDYNQLGRNFKDIYQLVDGE